LPKRAAGASLATIERVMKSETFSILAVEPDPERARHLKRLLHEQVDAKILVTHSSDVAIASLAFEMPDLVVTSALLPPSDDSRLMSHLKEDDSTQHLPVLTVPPAVGAPRPKPAPWPFALFADRAGGWHPYDPDAVGARIADALRRARRERNLPRPARRLLAAPDHEQEMATDGEACTALTLTRHRQARAHRWTRTDIRWLRTVQTPWGLELQVLNISASGLLVESPSKLLPESATELQLIGSGLTLTMPARFVRSEVADVNGLGVRYRTAAVFERRLELVPESAAAARPPASPEALAGVLAEVTGELARGAQPGAIRRTFERSLEQLLPAREIRLCDDAETVVSYGDSISIPVPGDVHGRAVLQVTFEPNYAPNDEESKLMKAAALLAGVVLQYEGKR
jgi:hypothetical protein